MMRSFFALLLCVICLTVNAQKDPCKSYPMAGYTGYCEIGSLTSSDGQHIYTFDQTTIKKWDVNTGRVVAEVPGGPWVEKILPDTNYMYVDATSTEKSVWDRRTNNYATCATLLGPEFSRYKIFKEDAHGRIVADDRKNNILIAYRSMYQQVNYHRIDRALGKSTPLTMIKSSALHCYLPELGLLGFEDDDGVICFLRVSDNKVLKTKAIGQINNLKISPDGKRIAVTTDGGFFILDTSTLLVQWSVNAENRVKGAIYFRRDGLGFYTCSEERGSYRQYTIKELKEYKLPDFSLVNSFDNSHPFDWRTIDKNHYSLFIDADKDLISLQSAHAYLGGPAYKMFRYSLKNGALVDTISFRYKMNTAELDADKKARERRYMIGNKAIDLLQTMEQPSAYHISDKPLKIQDYTSGGRVLISERDGGYILWEFPSGRPIVTYQGQYSEKKEGVPTDAAIIPGEKSIENALLSPDGEYAAFNTYAGGYKIYRGKSLTVSSNKGTVIELFNRRAFIVEMRDGEIKGSGFIDITNGTTVSSLAIKEFDLDRMVRISPTKIAIPESPGEGKQIKIFDAESATMVSVAPEEAVRQGYPAYTGVPSESNFAYHQMRLNNITGVEEKLPGFNFQKGTWIRSKRQKDNFILTAGNYEGLNVYDINKGQYVSNEPLYAGWQSSLPEERVYFKDIKIMLLVGQRPNYTWPRATNDDPGASAYTVNLKTAEVIPYTLHEPRATFMKKVAAQQKAAEEYAYRKSLPSEICKDAAAQFKEHTVLNNCTVLIMGYDCELKAFVCAVRTKEVGSLGEFGRNRFQLKTLEELKSYGPGSCGRYTVCPSCGGNPTQEETRYFTGWTDWENTVYNEYSRKYVKNRAYQVYHICDHCHGKAWIKLP